MIFLTAHTVVLVVSTQQKELFSFRGQYDAMTMTRNRSCSSVKKQQQDKIWKALSQFIIALLNEYYQFIDFNLSVDTVRRLDFCLRVQ